MKGESAIETLDKSGRVTLHIKESDKSWGDQVAMLNVMVTEIFALSLEHFQDQINVPIGQHSEIVIPINYMNEHAHLFAKNLEGVELDVELSHPQVVSAEVDYYSEKITLRPKRDGECIIVVRLRKDPEIFDMFKIVVDRLVEPSSTAYLHLGAEVDFIVPQNKKQ